MTLLVLGAGSRHTEATADSQSSSPAIADALSRYARGDWTGVERVPVSNLKAVRGELAGVAPNLIASVGPLRARHLLAAFSTEVAARSLINASVADYEELLEWGCVLVRGHTGNVDAFDETWFSAYVAAIEAHNNYMLLRFHLGHVKEKFPRHTELARGEALALEQQMSFGGQGLLSHILPGGKPAPKYSLAPDAVKDATRAYKSLLNDPEYALEARVRLGRVQTGTGQFREALATLAVTPPTDDSSIQFWIALFRGTAHRELGQLPEAIASFREAVQIAPRASSANIALAGVLHLNGQRDEARQITDDFLRAGPGIDPWYTYFRGSFRRIDRFVDDMRRKLQ